MTLWIIESMKRTLKLRNHLDSGAERDGREQDETIEK